MEWRIWGNTAWQFAAAHGTDFVVSVAGLPSSSNSLYRPEVNPTRRPRCNAQPFEECRLLGQSNTICGLQPSSLEAPEFGRPADHAGDDRKTASHRGPRGEGLPGSSLSLSRTDCTFIDRNLLARDKADQ